MSYNRFARRDLEFSISYAGTMMEFLAQSGIIHSECSEFYAEDAFPSGIFARLRAKDKAAADKIDETLMLYFTKN